MSGSKNLPLLQDPPSFRVLPQPEYFQEVGRDLIIPCEAVGDPTPNITWSKVQKIFYSDSYLDCTHTSYSCLIVTCSCPSSQIGPTPRSLYTVMANGSLLLQPLSKDHQGGWECLATNRVVTVSAGTVVMVLGERADLISANHRVRLSAATRIVNSSNLNMSFSVPQAQVLMLYLQYLSPRRWTRPMCPGCLAMMVDTPRSSLYGQ